MEESRYNSPDAFVMAELKDAHTQLEHLKNQVNDLLAKLNQRDAEIAQLLNEKADFIALVNPKILRFGEKPHQLSLYIGTSSFDKYLGNGESYEIARAYFGLAEPTAEEYRAEERRAESNQAKFEEQNS